MQSACAALYCHLWPAPLYNIFPHYLTNGTTFWKKLSILKYVLIFSTTFVWNISHSRKNWARYDKNVHWSCPISTKLEFSGYIFEKSSHIKFYENPSSERRVPRGWTDRHDEANHRFSQFCESA